jgi:hypothetical protein
MTLNFENNMKNADIAIKRLIAAFREEIQDEVYKNLIKSILKPLQATREIPVKLPPRLEYAQYRTENLVNGFKTMMDIIITQYYQYHDKRSVQPLISAMILRLFDALDAKNEPIVQKQCLDCGLPCR